MRPINSFCVVALLVLIFTKSCSQMPAGTGKDKIKYSNAISKMEANDTTGINEAKNLFRLSEAEKILGEPAHLVDSATNAPGIVNDSVSPIKRTAASYGCAYEANLKDEKTGRTGKVFFKVEQYPQVSSAVTVYSYYKRSNQTHPGFKERHDVGDEAWYGDSPFSIYVRKGNKIFGIKVNRPTSKTSLDGFNQVIKNIVAAF